MALHVQGLPNELNRLTDAKMKVSVGVVFVVSFFLDGEWLFLCPNWMLFNSSFLC